MIEFADLRDLPVFEGVCDATLNRASRTPRTCASTRASGSFARARRPRSTCCCRGVRPDEALPDGMRRLAVREEPRRLPRRAADRASARRSSPAPARATPLRVARFDRAAVRPAGARVAGLQRSPRRRASGARRGSRDRGGRPAGPPDRDRPAARPDVPRPARLPLAQPGALRVGRPGRGVGRGARPTSQHALAAAADCSVVLLPDGRILRARRRRSSP